MMMCVVNCCVVPKVILTFSVGSCQTLFKSMVFMVSDGVLLQFLCICKWRDWTNRKLWRKKHLPFFKRLMSKAITHFSFTYQLFIDKDIHHSAYRLVKGPSNIISTFSSKQNSCNVLTTPLSTNYGWHQHFWGLTMFAHVIKFSIPIFLIFTSW